MSLDALRGSASTPIAFEDVPLITQGTVTFTVSYTPEVFDGAGVFGLNMLNALTWESVRSSTHARIFPDTRPRVSTHEKRFVRGKVHGRTTQK